MTTGLITPDDSRWLEALQKSEHDFYHLPGYSKLEARPEERAVAFYTEGCLIPFLLKPIPGEPNLFDAQTPYGYPGPIFSKTDPAFRAAAIAAVAPELGKHNVVTAFARLHTLINQDVSPFAGQGVLVQHGETVVIDCTQTDEEMWKQTRDNHRRGIKSLTKAGATVEVDESWNAFPEFHACYTQTMQRVNASAYYFFTPEYFYKLREALSNRLHLCVVRLNGAVACGGVFAETGDLLQYHLGGTAEAALAAHPSKLMFHYIRSWARQRGLKRLHLGGGVGGQADSLFLFKKGFSNWTVPFHTWRLIVQPEIYSRLISNWETKAGVPAESITGYFPPYRKAIR